MHVVESKSFQKYKPQLKYKDTTTKRKNKINAVFLFTSGRAFRNFIDNACGVHRLDVRVYWYIISVMSKKSSISTKNIEIAGKDARYSRDDIGNPYVTFFFIVLVLFLDQSTSRLHPDKRAIF